MLQYPSILGVKKMPLGQECVAFYKYDGSNLRFEWSQKRGWHKFGSRTQIVSSNHEVFGEAITMFNEQMGHIIIDRLKNFYGQEFKNIERVTAFAEFYGEGSFAGHHQENDEKKLKLFDIFLFKKGFIHPKDFMTIFGDWDSCAEVVYRGILDEHFVQKVRDNNLDRVLNEGVICKGVSVGKEQLKKHGTVWMTKIKTLSYLNKLKDRYLDDWERYSE